MVGRRPDGYHLLDSLVGFASIGDRVRVAAGPRLDFSVEGRFAAHVPSGTATESNLAVKAARLLAVALDRPADVSIRLRKSLPVAAGIGGGSADAAAVLRALAELWGIDRRDPRIAALAGRLGADVPVCLASRTSHIHGIGDRVEPASPLSGVPIVLANPLVPVATPEVFGRFSGPFSAPSEPVDPPASPSALARWLSDRRNDLAGPAEEVAPQIGTVMAALACETGCLLARMSGSGATCFGLFGSGDSAAEAAHRVESANPDWWVRSGSLI